ncbi:LacI family DNA-binding transcriptional regulator [Ruania halotolerans]|uniref:LacI family DNA-binding transcriptional regulator n=1 Tax=Ruania halotolerans TaxID=2897773 RepID=UPI001E55DC4E|nr:LacI family DNA-binding transcriptional regulator [Ruania halotolerans]UFU06421.1 LacI family transcriptional regulator [Ruania halotolerans]
MTRADVASAAGVSTAVVSYTLNNGPKNVAPATRERVLEAVRTLGYRPNATARALRLGSTGQVGLVVATVSNPYFGQLTDQVERSAAARGLALLVRTNSGGLVREAIEQLAARQVDGMLIARPMDANDAAAVAESGVPAVLINEASGPAGVPSVGVDRYGGARRAVEHLIEHGHHRVGLIGAGDGGHRQRGWADALAGAGLPPGPVVAETYSREGGYRAVLQLLALPDPPTAVFASSDEQAVGALLALHESEVPVPGGMAVIAFDGSAASAFTWPPLTAVAQPMEMMVERALDRLLGLEQNVLPTELPSTELLPTELLRRRSCGC